MTQQLRPAPTSEHGSRTPRRPLPRCPRPHCHGNMIMRRDGDYVTVSCLACSRPGVHLYRPRPLRYEIRLPLRREEILAPAGAKRPHPNPTLDTEEPQLTNDLKKYCDLRRRGYSVGAIRNRTGWPEYYPDLLLEEAMRRGMKGADENAKEAFKEWLLEMFDSATDPAAICHMSTQPEHETKKNLKEALDAASGPRPEQPIIVGPDGQPARVSWNTPDGRLCHRAFDGPLPTRLPNWRRCRTVPRCSHQIDHRRQRTRPRPRLHDVAHGRSRPPLPRPPDRE